MRWLINPNRSAMENLFDACRVATYAMRNKYSSKLMLSREEWDDLCNEVILASVQQFMDSKIRRHTYCHEVSFYMNCASCVLSTWQFKLKYFLKDVKEGMDNVDRWSPELRAELLDTACPVNYLNQGSGSSFAARQNLDAWKRGSEHGNFLKGEYADNYWDYLEACEETGIDVNKNALDYLLGCQYATGTKEKVQMILIRDSVVNDAVMGTLLVGGVLVAHTLENKDKLLPYGEYSLVVNKSPSFGRDLPLIFNDKIKKSRGFRIHAGNRASESRGCILVGNGRMNDTITDSRDAERAVTAIARNDSTLLIVNNGTIL